MLAPLVALVVLVLALPAGAQPAWDTLSVPGAALRLLRVDADQGRALALQRVVRVLHALPREGDPPQQIAEFEHLLRILDAFELEAQRLGTTGLSLAMARTAAERDVLRDVLKTLKLRLRERRGAYTVEPESDREAIADRKLLASAGIDADRLAGELNQGRAVQPVPATSSLPSPLPLDAWTGIVLERPVPPRSLFSAIARDRHAALLLAGLQAMTLETRRFVANDRELLRHLYRDNAGAVAAFGEALRIVNGRPVLPGGAESAALWEALVDERLDRPERFARALFDRDAGRLAYFVHTLSLLDEAHTKFAMGLWTADRGARLDRFRTLYRTFVDVDPSWSISRVPYSRPLYDPAMIVRLVRVDENGAPQAPAYRRLWTKALDGVDLPSRDAHEVGNPAEEGVLDAAWLVEHTRHDLSGERRLLSERFAFGQRIFRSASDAHLEEVLVALRAFGRYPALMLALERAGIRTPAAFADVARRARALEETSDPAVGVPLVGQFQGALAVVLHLARTGALDPAQSERLVRSLAALPSPNGHYSGRVAAWLSGELLPQLAGPAGIEATGEHLLLAGLADRGETRSFEWEGMGYVTDVAATSRAELGVLRTGQGGNTLDDVLLLAAAVRGLSQPSPTLDAIQQGGTALKAVADRLKPLRPWPEVTNDPPDVKKVLGRAVRDIARITKPRDLDKAARATEPVQSLTDALLAETLVAFAYLPWLGDRSGLGTLQADESHRHSFGLKDTVGPKVERRAWQLTAADLSRPGGSSFLGSLLSLDLAHGTKRLRRLAVNQVPTASQMNPNDREALTETLVLLNPRDLDTTVMSKMGEAIARGRALVRGASDAAALDALAMQVAMPGVRRAALSWAKESEPGTIDRLFGMGELLSLGWQGPAQSFDGWGVTSAALSGCLCVHLPLRSSWEALAGRPGAGILGTAVPDILLRSVEHLTALRVPAALAPDVLAITTQEMIDTAPALYEDDWAGIVGYAQHISREDVEDYVSSLLAAGGPVRPATPPGASAP